MCIRDRLSTTATGCKIAGNAHGIEFKTASANSASYIQFSDHNNSDDGRIQYEHSSDEFLFLTTTSWTARLHDDYFKPETKNAIDLGLTGQRFKNLWLAGNADVTGNATFGGAVSVASKTVSQTATAVSALEIDCATGNYFTKAISTSSTFTFANVPASGTAYGFVLEVDCSNASTAITWPAAVKWPGGTAPTLTDTKTHVFTFATVDGGTTWRASSLVDYTT